MYIKSLNNNNEEINIKVGIEERILDHYFNGNVKLMPLVDYFNEKPGYKLVYVNKIKNRLGEEEEKYIDILDSKTDKPVFLSREIIEDLKNNYIKKITSGR